MKQIVLYLYLILASLWLAGATVAAPPPEPLTAPQKGALLVASADMPDPRFQQTVILLLEHNAEGTLGLVLNRPTEVRLSEAVPELENVGKQPHTLFFGGPVAPSTMLFLVRDETAAEQMAPVLENLHWSASRLVLERLLGADKSNQGLRIYFGRAGWSPGQLDAELADGSWQLFKADATVPFQSADALESLWQDLMQSPEADWIMAGI